MVLSHSGPDTRERVTLPLLKAAQHSGPLCTSNKLTQFVRLVFGFVEADAHPDKLSQLTLLTLPLPKKTFASAEQVSRSLTKEKKIIIIKKKKNLSFNKANSCPCSFLTAWPFGSTSTKRRSPPSAQYLIILHFLYEEKTLKKSPRILHSFFLSISTLETLNLTRPQLTHLPYHLPYHSPSNMKTTILDVFSDKELTTTSLTMIINIFM